jgi:hypothetical protein
MTRSFVVVLALLSLVVVGGELLGPRPDAIEHSAAAMPSLQELHSMANVTTLPLQEVEDQALIFNQEARPQQ